MFYYRQHRDMDATQYVQVDVYSGFLFYRKFYYTHHSEMYATQYVHGYVTSIYFCQ